MKAVRESSLVILSTKYKLSFEQIESIEQAVFTVNTQLYFDTLFQLLIMFTKTLLDAQQRFSIFIDFLDNFFSSVIHNRSLQWHLHNLSFNARKI